MNQLKFKKKLAHYISIIVGTLLISVSVNMVYEPLGMVTGGVGGIAIIIKHFTSQLIEGGIPLWISNIVLNVPLFILAFMVKGKKFIKDTLFGTVCLTIGLYIVPSINVISDDYLLASVFGATLSGMGLGIIFMTHSTTGGTDLLAMVINKFKPYYSAPQILIVVDAVIVIGGALSFGLSKALYAIIAVYITSKVSDGILEGLKFAKMAHIISDHYEEIADCILTKLDRGVTGLSATGMYSNKDKKMLICVVSKKEIVDLTETVKEIDKNAFVIVSDVREVLGEGFREYRQ